MRFALPVLLLLALLLLPSAQLPPLEIPGAGGSLGAPPTVPPSPDMLPGAGLTLAYSVLIENRSGGVVRVIEPPAQLLFNRPGDDIGQVTNPAERVGPGAVRQGGGGRLVSRSSLADLRLMLFEDQDTGAGGEIVLLPRQMPAESVTGPAANSGENVIETNIPAGSGIFGGKYPLSVGSPVFVYRGGQRIYLAPGSEALELGDVIIIEVAVPATAPGELTIENSAGGAVRLTSGGSVQELGSGEASIAAGLSASAQAARRPGVIACEPKRLSLLFSLGTAPVELEVNLSSSDSAGTGPPTVDVPTTVDAGFIPDAARPAIGALALGSQFAYLFPASGQEPPDGLPQVELLVQWKGSSAWLPPPLTFTAEDLKNIGAFKLAWRDPLAVPAPPAPIPGVEIAPADPQTLRGH